MLRLRGPDQTGSTLPRPSPTWRTFIPFAVVTGVCLATLALPPYHRPPLASTVLAIVFLLASTTCLLLGMRREHRSWLDPMAAWLMFPFIAFVRDVAGGGDSGLTAMVLLPLLWLAVTGTRRELDVAVWLACLTFLLPLALHQDGYPVSDWRRAATWVAIALVFGPLVQSLVRRIEREADKANAARAGAESANRELTLANERARRLFEDAPHGVAVLDAEGRIINVNQALRDLAGTGADELIAQPLSVLSPDGDRTIEEHVDRLMERGRGALTTDAKLSDRQGNDLQVSLSSRVVRHADPDRDFVIVNVLDVSERRRYEDRLSHLADHDVLTGLPNRRRFDAELQRHLEHCRRHGLTGAVLLLDLDNFKQVNDTLGHAAGDELLVTIGGLLRRSVRGTDLVARLGGDEFAVLLTDGDQAAAERVADSLVEGIRKQAATLDGVRRRVTASVGVVTLRAAAQFPNDVLALADMTMYDAKEAGRDQQATLAEGNSRPPRVGARLQWQSRIESALENDRFTLLLQPILDLSTDEISSAEVLLRLSDSDTLVPPSRFLYIAERAGLAPQLDAWVVRHSVKMLADLRRVRPDFQLEVNLSGLSIGDPLIEEAITSALTEHQVDPGALILEITETAAVSDVSLARAFAERLIEGGCKFALDDFGAGFGSFYYLKHLLFDYVKIDGEFVANSHDSEVDRTILRSIVGIAHDLGKRTVAEFVSSDEILEVVRAEGVDLAQGYLIGEPTSYDDFVSRFCSRTPREV